MKKNTKTLKKLAKQTRFSRQDLLVILNEIEYKLDGSGASRLMDVKEDLGFQRYEGE